MLKFIFSVTFLCIAVSLPPFMNQTWAQVVINEVCSYNGSTIEDEDGDESDWIELYNAGTATISLHQYSLTDSKNEPWMLPGVNLAPQQFLIVFASGKNRYGAVLHTSFKLEKDGEILSLFNPSGILSDQLTIPSLQLNHSLGRLPDGSSVTGIMVQPSPGMTAPSQPLYTGYAPDPQFSSPVGFYAGIVSITLNTPAASVIRYTLDGRPPDSTSTPYTIPLSLSQTTVVRAVSFSLQPLVLPSNTITQTYLINYTSSLPVFSISTHPDLLWDWNTGIYVAGPNASPVYPYYGANFWQNVEIETYVEFFETDGERQIAQKAGVEIHGGTSNRTRPMKSLRLSAKNKYGEANFNHPFFKIKDIASFKNIVLRNSSFDFNKTHFRDGSLHELMIGRLNIDLEAYRPAVVFLNGVYFGVHNIREKISKHYPAENYGVSPDSLDLLEEDTIALAGNFNAFNNLHAFITGNNMSQEALFAQAAEMIDTESLCDYYVAETFLSNIDWPYNNMKYWRHYGAGAKWRYILVDLDISLGTNGWAPASFDVLGRVMGPYGDTSRHVQIFKGLLQNSGYKEYFINRYADLVNTLFKTENLRAHIMQVRNRIETEMPLHFQKWGNDMQGWDQEIDQVVMPYIDQRPAYAKEQVRSVFNLNAIQEVTLDVWPPGAGTIHINTIQPEPLPWKGDYFDGNPITLSAQANPGFVFSGWQSQSIPLEHPSAIEIRVNPITANRFTATFSRLSDPGAIQVFPNPSSGQIEAGYVALHEGTGTLRITDATGKTLMNKESLILETGLNIFKEDVSRLRSGVYMISILSGDQARSARFTVY